MFILVIIGIAVLSILFAVLSLWKQRRIDELKKAKRALKKHRVIYHKDS